MTDLVINEIVESKVSKTEMIEMIMTEEEAVLSQKLIAMQANLINHLDYVVLQDELTAIYRKIAEEKHKEITKLFAKQGNFTVNSFMPTSNLGQKLGTFKIPYNTNPAQLQSNNRGIAATSIGTIAVGDHFVITSQKLSSYMKMTLNAKSPQLTAYVKKLKKIEKEQSILKLEVDKVKLQLNKVMNSTKLVKARLTRNLLESTAEGRLMLKKLEKVKGKVVGQLMIEAGGR